MIFTKSLDDAYICESEDDVTADDKYCGVISKGGDGYWRWHMRGNITLNCSEMKRIAIKICELNSGGGDDR